LVDVQYKAIMVDVQYKAIITVIVIVNAGCSQLFICQSSALMQIANIEIAPELNQNSYSKVATTKTVQEKQTLGKSSPLCKVLSL